MRRGGLQAKTDLIAECLRAALAAGGGGKGGEATKAAPPPAPPARSAQEEAQRFAATEAAAGAELVDAARGALRAPAVYAALAAALARASGAGAKAEGLVLARLEGLLRALLLPGGAYASDALRGELRRARLPAAVSAAMGAAPHTAEAFAKVLSLLH